jgi:hypothetical protein
VVCRVGLAVDGKTMPRTDSCVPAAFDSGSTYQKSGTVAAVTAAKLAGATSMRTDTIESRHFMVKLMGGQGDRSSLLARQRE